MAVSSSSAAALGAAMDTLVRPERSCRAQVRMSRSSA